MPEGQGRIDSRCEWTHVHLLKGGEWGGHLDSLHPEVLCSQAGIVDAEMDGSIDLDGILNLETNRGFITSTVSLSLTPHMSSKIQICSRRM